MIKIAIVDDEKVILEVIVEKIKYFITSKGIDVKIFSYTSAKNFLSDLNDKSLIFQAYFLDLDMPELSGFDLSEVLREKSMNSPIVYITNREDLMQQAFQYEVLGFVRKKYLESELDYAVNCVINKWKKTISKIEIQSKGKLYLVNLSDIVYIGCEKHHAVIHLNNGSLIYTTDSIVSFTKRIEMADFILINSGCFLNYEYIISIDKMKISLKNNEVLYSSRRKCDAVIKQYMTLTQRNLL